jgi:TATA-binding protein-associated factor Taf7
MRVANAPRTPRIFLEHHVRDLMAREAQARAVRADLIAEQPLPREHVVEFEHDVEAVGPLRLSCPTTM